MSDMCTINNQYLLNKRNNLIYLSLVSYCTNDEAFVRVYCRMLEIIYILCVTFDF